MAIVPWRRSGTMLASFRAAMCAAPGLVTPRTHRSRWSDPPGCLCICPGRVRLKAQAHVCSHVTSPGSRARAREYRRSFSQPFFSDHWRDVGPSQTMSSRSHPLTVSAENPSDLECLGRDAGWTMVVRHLDAALSILDRIGEGGTHSASDIENALVYAKKELRALRREHPRPELGDFPPG